MRLLDTRPHTGYSFIIGITVIVSNRHSGGIANLSYIKSAPAVYPYIIIKTDYCMQDETIKIKSMNTAHELVSLNRKQIH